MKKRAFLIAALALALASLTLGAWAPSAAVRPVVLQDPKAGAASDAVRAFGHGVFIGGDGQPVKVTRELVEQVQAQHIARLRPKGRVLVDEIERLINQLVPDRIVAGALYLDHLIEKTRPDDRANLIAINNALRWQYLLEMRGDRPPKKGERWSKGVDPRAAAQLERKGVKVFLVVQTGGEAYIDECRKAGVPVPNAMFSKEWTFRGEVTNEFLPGSFTELWSFQSESPRGICLALPRYPSASSSGATLLGMICLGTDTSKACFFDNPRGTQFQRNEEVPITSFVGGVDLVANAQGTCSDCHAGENPFVVHPDQPPYAAILNSLRPLAWHDPLVDASWPQNPGPTVLLDAVASPGRCDTCHRPGSAGRFPELSTSLPGYCGVVLATAVGPAPLGTMPQGMDKTLFKEHIKALEAACDGPGSTGVDVPFDGVDDGKFLSAPRVIDPLYACATKVAVRGAQLDAMVTLRINGGDVGSKRARNPDFVEFDVPALVKDQVVTAIQTAGGPPSDPSDPVTVRDHREDYPAGLPAPTIDPTAFYECASAIAVRHVPGATLTVLSNGVDPRSWNTSTGWTVAHPAKRPFVVGDKFSAEASLCADRSLPSVEEDAVAAPGSLPAPTFNPAATFDGQELVTLETLVHGATTSISELTAGAIGNIGSWPVSWFPNYDVVPGLGRPLSGSDRLRAGQQLCSKSPTTETPEPLPCDQLPAPRIAHPLVGQTFVVVTQSVPGARIRVYDGANVEIGDGSGTVVSLSRAITGTDTLTVVQQVGKCTSRNGYRVSVRNAGAQKG